MLATALLLLPDFLLIVIGFVLCRYSALDRPVWDAVERLVYYLLFPVLLFNAIVKSPLDFSTTAPLAGAGLGIALLGIASSYALGRLPGVDPQLHASGAQVAFRFNSYVALALADKLAGPDGVAWTAVLVALCVPVCNFGAVYPLARHGGHRFWHEIARNPLIISTVAGLLANLGGLRLGDPLGPVLGRIGQAALPLGLMAVGAGLKLGGLWAGPGLAAGLLGIRHVLLPLAALGGVVLLGVPEAQQPVVVAFAAMPTASSCYVLAMRMGGNGPYTAGLVTVSTLLGMASIPVWLAVLGWR
ncbi:AEC family transporter [Eleftheria terrae]|uniref:AEC family transporter n=1 Tax=Eleftheria terrae TaxID=1597781 RepID=UPI00263A832D|nr:AEC family transporter [Eleftheria terrae]WKB55616.1 AEC family transporter [Eleftheria terrae]